MVLEQLGTPHVSSVGCDDLAVFYDPFSEILKPTLACGNNGGEIAIWDGSLDAWSRTTNVGNSSRIEAAPNGETGFFVQWSGRKVTPDTEWGFNQVIAPRAPDLQPAGFMVVPIRPEAIEL